MGGASRTAMMRVAMRPRLPCRRFALLICALLPFGAGAQVATGTYRGVSYVPLVVTGLGFRPDVVLIKGDLGVGAALATASLPKGVSKSLGDSGDVVTDGVRTLDSDGFTVVDSSYRVNRAETEYAWVAFKAVDGEVALGSYEGDGTADRRVEGLGLRPGLLLIIPEASHPMQWRTDAMPEGTSFATNAGPLLQGRILGFKEGGFRIGDHVSVNAAAVRYHYVAFRAIDGFLEVGRYRGNGLPGREIGPAGMQELILLKPNANTHALFRPRALQGASTPYLYPLPHAPDRIAPLEGDGIRVSDHLEVNAPNVEHYYAAWSAGPRARLLPARQEVLAPAEVLLSGSGSTPGSGATVTDWRWTQREGPTGVPLASGAEQRLTLQHPGRYVFELEITDSGGHTSRPTRAEVVVTGDVWRPDPELRGCQSSPTTASLPWSLVLLGLAWRRAARRRVRPAPAHCSGAARSAGD